jgi:hypothetical protein
MKRISDFRLTVSLIAVGLNIVRADFSAARGQDWREDRKPYQEMR